jgi:hypothetical protein
MQSIRRLAKCALRYEPGRHTKVLWVCAEGFSAPVQLWSIEVLHETSIHLARVLV